MDEVKDLKEEETPEKETPKEETPTGTGQPEKTVPEPGAKKETEEDTVMISKAELTKLQEEKENYRKGMLSLKRKGRTLPDVKPDGQSRINYEDGESGDDGNEFVTKKDFKGREQKSAIAEACQDSEVDENWDDIMFYYKPEHGQDDRDNVLLDIQKAKKLWRANNPIKPEDQSKKVVANLAADKGLGSGKEKKANPPAEGRRIIPKNDKMTDWYNN